MKDQSSSTMAEIVIESLQHSEDTSPPKKLDTETMIADMITCSSSDEDSGSLKASNISWETRNDQDVPEPSRLNIPSEPKLLTDKETLNIIESAIRQFKTIPEEEKRCWVMSQMTEAFGDKLTEPLLEIATAHMFDGDSGLGVDTRPDWLDLEKFRRGQKFALKYLFATIYAELISLITAFTFEDGLKPMIATGGSSTPYTAFKRYLSTGIRMRNWYKSDPWTPGTEAYNDIKVVRRMHAMVRRHTEAMTNEDFAEKTRIQSPWCPALETTRSDFESTCAAPAPGQCPYTLFSRFPCLKGKKLSQGEMAATQFVFVGLIVLNPKFFGIHYASDDDLEAFCHVWRGLGYLLGIEDNFNFCRGSLADVQARSRDLLEYWVKPNFRVDTPEWEHMMRCLVEGVLYYFPGTTYEICLLDVAEIMNLHMPRLHNTLSFSAWIKYRAIRFYFNYGSKLSSFNSLMNHRVSQALKKANKFDEQKHRQLQMKSTRTLGTYAMKQQKNKA